MAKGRASFMKRQRERERAEKAALKRERKAQRDPSERDGDRVATKEDLDGYGLLPEEDEPEPRGQGSGDPAHPGGAA